MNECTPTRFKSTDSPLTPHLERRTTFSIHEEGTARFMQRLVATGRFALLPEGTCHEDDLPQWSLMPARRWRNNLDDGLIARGFVLRLTGDVVSVAVYASAANVTTSAVERAVGRTALAGHPFLAVIADRNMRRPPAFAKRFQEPIGPDAASITGIRTDVEIIEHLTNRP